jgi:RNA polymerase sigma factor (TIGR02999 family)
MNPSESQPDQTPSDPGGPRAADRAFWVRLLYNELRALAQSELDLERRNHTLSATALVNEAYLKLAQPGSAAGGDGRLGRELDRGTFFGLAAQAMRRILVDHARGKRRQKRGGGQPVAGGETLGFIADPNQDGSPLDAVALDDALTQLALEHEQAAQVVELRFFAGLHDQAIAECLGINERTVRRHWTFAKAWLAREITPDNPPPETFRGSTAR